MRRNRTRVNEKQGPGGVLFSDGGTVTLNVVSAFVLLGVGHIKLKEVSQT